MQVSDFLMDGILAAINFLFYFFVLFALIIGVILIIAPKAFFLLDDFLSKQYGFRIWFLKNIEQKSFCGIDATMKKHRLITGALIISVSVVLLFIYTPV